jgi:hypothetical protein
MFPFTPHTTLRLSFGLGGSLFSGDFADRLPVFFYRQRFWAQDLGRLSGTDFRRIVETICQLRSRFLLLC